MKEITIPALAVKQPIGGFYIGVIKSSDLYEISYADVRRKEGREIEKYIGTQRDLSEGRVAELKKYVNNVDACFPTSIILAIESKDLEIIENNDTISLKIRSEDGKVAKIIDGQHRIAGLESYKGDDFFINVTIFVDMELEDQAMVFATINLKQTKVTKSLTYDLYEFATARSPQKTCHHLARILNFKDGSPLKGHIKILGKASDGPIESITQATFVDRVMKLITRAPDDDKDALKRNRSISKAMGSDQKKLIFRNLFIEKEDAKIAFILWEYFSAVSMRWPGALQDREKGMILGRTTGFAALIRLLPDVISRIIRRPLEEDSSDIHRDEFLKVLKLIELRPGDFNSERYLPGSTGEGALYRDFLAAIRSLDEKWVIQEALH